MKKQISYTGKHIFWKQKNRVSLAWSEGYVHKQEGDMILIGTDESIVSKLYHSDWFGIKDLNIKVQSGKG
jgi:hypothetical protein